MRSQRLAEPHGGGGLALAQRSRRDRGYDNVFAVRNVPEAIAKRQVHFSLGFAVEFQLFRQNASLGGDPVNRNRSRGLCNLDIAGDTCEYVR
jgi:hypothetical protein